MPSYEPQFLRSKLINTVADSPVDREADLPVAKWLKGLDARQAKRQFDKLSPEFRKAQEQSGIDPRRDLELLQQIESQDPSFLTNLRAGAEDAALNLASIGANLVSRVPAPLRESLGGMNPVTTEQVIKERRKLLSRVMENRSDTTSPGKAVSEGSKVFLDLYNPVGKAKYANAAYHAIRSLGQDSSPQMAGVAGVSNVAGEAIESQLGRIPGLSTLLGKAGGLPGNVAGKLIEDTTAKIESEVARKRSQKK